MTSTNCYCVNLDLGFNIDQSVLKTLHTDHMPFYGFKQFDIEHSIIDPMLVKFLKARDIDISHAEAFYTLPGKKIPIHVDHDVMDNHCKLNFVYGAAGSVMQWWKLKHQDTELKYQLTTIGTRYLMFDSKDCELVWQCQVGQPGLINAGQPHSVVNCTDQPRTTLSLVLYDLKKQQLLDWYDAVEIFRDVYE